MSLRRPLLRLLLLLGLVSAGLVVPAAAPAQAASAYTYTVLPPNTSSVVRKIRQSHSCVSRGRTYLYYSEAEVFFARVNVNSLKVSKVVWRHYIPNNVIAFHAGRQYLYNKNGKVSQEYRREWKNPRWNGSNSFVAPAYTKYYNKIFYGGQANGRATVTLTLDTAACGGVNYNNWLFYVK